MPTARFSCGTSTGRGSSAPLSLARAKPSMTGGKSVPGLAKKCSMPWRRSAVRMTSAAVACGLAAGSAGGIAAPCLSVEFDVGGFGNCRPARNLGGDPSSQLLPGTTAGVDGQPRQALAHVRQPDDLDQLPLQFLTMPSGVAAGANSPDHRRTSKSATPSGYSGIGAAAVLASTLIRPALMWPATAGASASATSTSPPTTAVTISPLLL